MLNVEYTAHLQSAQNTFKDKVVSWARSPRVWIGIALCVIGISTLPASGVIVLSSVFRFPNPVDGVKGVVERSPEKQVIRVSDIFGGTRRSTSNDRSWGHQQMKAPHRESPMNSDRLRRDQLHQIMRAVKSAV